MSPLRSRPRQLSWPERETVASAVERTSIACRGRSQETQGPHGHVETSRVTLPTSGFQDRVRQIHPTNSCHSLLVVRSPHVCSPYPLRRLLFLPFAARVRGQFCAELLHPAMKIDSN